MDLKNVDPIPKGGIIMFSGEIAPLGWRICDGSEGTPDLRGRFVLSSGEGLRLTKRTLDSTGGEEKHTLTLSEMPPHHHHGSNGAIGDYMHQAGYKGDTTASSDSAAQPHNIMPPYYVLAFIMKM